MTAIQKKRLGLLAPKGNKAIEYDFSHLLPEDVELTVGRLYRDGMRTPYERLFDMGTYILNPLTELGAEQMDLVAFGCTGGSFIGGLGYDRELAQRITAHTVGSQAVVAATAVLDALNALGAKRISVCSPYSGEWAFANNFLRQYYEDAGIEVLEIDATKVGQPLDEEVALDIAKKVDCSAAEAIFISCTDFYGALQAADKIEVVLRKPVITSNQATYWCSMQKLGSMEPQLGGGILLRENIPLPS